MTFFAGLRFHARTDRHTRLFQVWPEGHLLSSHEERRQRRAKGEPLGTPDALIFRAIVGLHNGGWPAPKFAGVESPSGAGPEFSLGKPAGRRTLNPTNTMRGPEAPGVRLGAGLKTCGGPKPGAVSPYVSLVFMITVGRFS